MNGLLSLEAMILIEKSERKTSGAGDRSLAALIDRRSPSIVTRLSRRFRYSSYLKGYESDPLEIEMVPSSPAHQWRLLSTTLCEA